MKTAKKQTKPMQPPTRTRFLVVGPASQIDIQVSPLNAEAKDDPAGMMRECQALATAHRLPVRFSCETAAAGKSRFTFYPEA